MPSSAVPERIRDYSRLTQTEIILALKLAEEGLTQSQIAQRVGCTQPTISRLLSEYGDSRELAKRRLHNAADRLAERVIKDATVEESLEVLDRIGVAERRRDQAVSMTAIAIGADMPLQLPSIPVNVIANYQTQSLSEGQQTQALTGVVDGEIEAKGEGRK